MSPRQATAIDSQHHARGQIFPGQTQAGLLCPGRAVSGDCHLGTLLRSAQEPLKSKAPSSPLSLPSHRNTTRGDFPGNFLQPLRCFISHCLPAPLGASTVKAAANTGCFSPRTPQRLLLLRLHVGKLALARCDPLGQGIRSVSQLVKQISKGNTGLSPAHPAGEVPFCATPPGY